MVDIAKHCHRALVRFFADDDRTTEVTWYFVPNNRAVLPYPTVFGMQDWEGDGIHDKRCVGTTDLGEQVPALGYYPWYNGRDAWGAPAVRACGTREEWAEGDSGEPLPPPTGLVPPCCFLGNHTVHAATGDVVLALVADGESRQRQGTRGTAALSLVAEGQRGLGWTGLGSTVLSLAAGGSAVLAYTAAGDSRLSLTAGGTSALAYASSGSSLLSLVADSLPTGAGIPSHSPGCASATLTPDKLHVVTTAATNGTCTDCANFAGSWSISWTSGCNWTGPGPVICGVARTINFGNSGGNNWFLGFQGIAGGYSVSLGSVWNGRDTLTLTASGFGSGFCTFPATIQVKPNTRDY